jgi:hypothetical protein
MNNMRSYSIAFYPETKKKLDALKEAKDLTWDELLNYLMEIKANETKDGNKKTLV